jgi:hypothetical protein
LKIDLKPAQTKFEFEYGGGGNDKTIGYHCQQFCSKTKIVLFSQKQVDDYACMMP